ncbi:hypothetical protein [Sphingomonas sp. LR60]|uniref:hypothetical protein n=1 Tax=Sphingomonas sp. LR60 TaxID=3050233 RepID=UPI002FDF8A6E
MPAVDPAAPLSVAEQAAMLAEMLATQDLIVALADDVRAAAVALALEAAMPTAAVLFCPGSDALPGEDAPLPLQMSASASQHCAAHAGLVRKSARRGSRS